MTRIGYGVVMIYGMTDGKKSCFGSQILLKSFLGMTTENPIMVSSFPLHTIEFFLRPLLMILSITQLALSTKQHWEPWHPRLSTTYLEWTMKLGSCYFLLSLECTNMEPHQYIKKVFKLGIVSTQTVLVVVLVAQLEILLLSTFKQSFHLNFPLVSCCFNLY